MRSGQDFDWGTAFLVVGLPFCVIFPPLSIVWVWILLRKLGSGWSPTSSLVARYGRRHPEAAIEHYRVNRGPLWGLNGEPEPDWAELEAARVEHSNTNCPLCKMERRTG